MNTKASPETAAPTFEVIKWVLVFLLIAAAVVGNSYFDDQPFLYRLIGVLVVGGLAAVVAAVTEKGKSFITLLKDARSEVRRVVWPSQQETLQTTGIVVLFVGVVALLLWLLDLGLGAVISEIIG